MVPTMCCREALKHESFFAEGTASLAKFMNCNPTMEARGQRPRSFWDFRFCDAKRFAHASSSHIKIPGFRLWRTIQEMHRGKNTLCLETIVDSAISSVRENCQNVQTTAIPFPDETCSPVKKQDFQKPFNVEDQFDHCQKLQVTEEHSRVRILLRL